VRFDRIASFEASVIEWRIMSRLTSLIVSVAAITIALAGLVVVPASATSTTGQRATLVGELGLEGGAYPGAFQPTAGTVEVAFNLEPLVLELRVGPSGKFAITLTPGHYLVTGCGNTASGAPGNQCTKPRNVTLAPGEVDHIRLVWLHAP
jgi:hypothetical protein